VHRLTAIFCVLILALAGCTRTDDPVSAGLDPAGSADPADPANPADPDTGVAGDDPSTDGPRRLLRPFASCESLLAHYIEGAEDLVGPYGLGGGYYGGGVIAQAASADDTAGGADTLAAAPAAGGEERQDVSGTNTQEAGVDEPDIVKTDGEVIVTSVTGQVQVVDVASGQVVATIPQPVDVYGSELLLDGTTLLILSTGSGPSPTFSDTTRIFPAFQPTRTTVTRVDLSDPANPAVLGSVRMEGAYRSARMVDGTVRFVMVSEPTGLAFTQPVDGGLTAEAEAEEENRRILAASDIDDWVPHLQVIDADGQAGAAQRLMDCTDINQPATFAGLSTLSVLTFDLRGTGLTPTSTSGLVASGDTVYASTDRLIVTTSPWGGWVVPFIDVIGQPERGELVTDIHSFDISDPAATRYVASGTVEGTLIGQFALSENAGVIRVATTTDTEWLGGRGGDSQSSLVVFTEQGEQLVQTGRLDGLGVTERIQAVRYLSPDLAAIVTFRQTDPLYLVDTADPTSPRLLGELKIPGFSAYLHPIGEGFLLGVGQDADVETGQTTGAQVSLFDIHDLANPQRVAQVDLGQGYSPVESDHRAFLYWAPTGQAVVPLELFGYTITPEGDYIEAPDQQFGGAVVLDVGAGTLSERGRITNSDTAPGEYAPGTIRSMVIGGTLWTLTYDSLASHTLDGLQRGTTIPLAPILHGR
jgi:hypothetical protein